MLRCFLRRRPPGDQLSGAAIAAIVVAAAAVIAMLGAPTRLCMTRDKVAARRAAL